MARRKDETLGWGTIGFWAAVVGIFVTVLLFGMFIPVGTRISEAPKAPSSQPAEPAQPSLPQGPAR